MDRYDLWTETQRDMRWTFVEDFHQYVRVPIRTCWLDSELEVAAITVYVYAANEGVLSLFIMSGIAHPSVKEIRTRNGVRSQDVQAICVCVWLVLLFTYTLQYVDY